MDKKIKLFIKIAAVLISLVFSINFIFGFILPMIPIPMYVGTNKDWLNFIGVFLGSGLTLLGVLWQTIKTKQHRLEELIYNTESTYELLENEVRVIKTFINYINFSLDEFYNNLIKPGRNSIENIKTTNDYIQIPMRYTIDKNILFNFINNSLPKEKKNLIKFSNTLFQIKERKFELKSVEKFQEFKSDFGKINENINFLSKDIENYIKIFKEINGIKNNNGIYRIIEIFEEVRVNKELNSKIVPEDLFSKNKKYFLKIKIYIEEVNKLYLKLSENEKSMVETKIEYIKNSLTFFKDDAK